MAIATTIAVAGAVIAGVAQGALISTIVINAAIAAFGSPVLGTVSRPLRRKP